MKELNYEKVFNTLVEETANYVTSNGLKAMVLGISGGIDSTVVAAICHEVSKKTGIPLIGRSLPIKNKEDEFDVSKLVGEAFCDEFKVFNLSDSQAFRLTVRLEEETVHATLDLVEVYVQERYYNADDDYLPDDFEDEMKFEVDDPELIKNLVDFVGNIGFCGVSDLVNDLLNEIEELTERYSVEAISFLSKELDSRGYFVD